MDPNYSIGVLEEENVIIHQRNPQNNVGNVEVCFHTRKLLVQLEFKSVASARKWDISKLYAVLRKNFVKKEKVQYVTQHSDSAGNDSGVDDDCYGIKALESGVNHVKGPYATVTVTKHKLKMLVDILDDEDYAEVGRPQLREKNKVRN